MVIGFDIRRVIVVVVAAAVAFVGFQKVFSSFVNFLVFCARSLIFVFDNFFSKQCSLSFPLIL
jgi:hypothetical protein